MADHAVVFAYEDEGGNGFLSPGAKFDIEKLIKEDSLLALDVLNDWFYIIAQYHAEAFAATYPALVPKTNTATLTPISR